VAGLRAACVSDLPGQPSAVGLRGGLPGRIHLGSEPCGASFSTAGLPSDRELTVQLRELSGQSLRTSGSTRYGIGVDSAIVVEVRTMSASATTS
jgi:hypothetical protein